MVDTSLIITDWAEESRCSEPPFLTRLRLRAQRRVLWMRALWNEAANDAGQGLAITHDEVDRSLSDPLKSSQAEDSFYERDEHASRLSQRITEADVRAKEDEAWQRLKLEFNLSAEETDFLSMLVAVEIEPLLRRVYGYLHDDANLCYATPWLATSLFQWDAPAAFGPESGLVKWRFALPMEISRHPWSITAPWMADTFIVNWLAHGEAADPALEALAEADNAAEAEKKSCLYPEQLALTLSFVRAMRRAEEGRGLDLDKSPSSIFIELLGPEGAGKCTFARQLCGALGRRMLVADAGRLVGLSPEVATEKTLRVARLARFKRATLYWRMTEEVSPKIWSTASISSDLMLFGSAAPLVQQHSDNIIRRVVRLPSLKRSARIELWQRLTNQPAPATLADWKLTPAEIVNAARVAPAGEEAVVHACRQMLHREPGELFMPLVCPYTWDEIVLTAPVRLHLEELERQARLRGPVYEEWGFEKLCPLGRGITALFSGPSGTGKTMAAQVLARSLEMELYRVDLAGVINKYIGETEKRLKKVFDACERADVVLFFDEADALFGQRMQVKDAHDRFANIEIDYLLQRMEQFDGIAILATNRKSDLDKAFLRRLRFIIDFLSPGPKERQALWHHALPEFTPDGQPLLEEVDWEFLADKLDMTGADIKASALAAAFLARAEGSRIGMRHILSAARREMTKHGFVLRPGDWKDLADNA